MSVYLVTYDLNKETNRPDLLSDIKEKFDGWAMLSESSYAISTHLTPESIYNTLSPHLDSNDVIYVIALSAPYRGHGPETVNKWLEDNL
ncbi:MAG: hypothetical protein GY701_08090 [Sulfitobacter sp.]|nr:hypothetical protein [Sulfitobacter sp.]